MQDNSVDPDGFTLRIRFVQSRRSRWTLGGMVDSGHERFDRKMKERVVSRMRVRGK